MRFRDTHAISTFVVGRTRDVASVAGAGWIVHVVVVLDANLNAFFGYSHGVRSLAGVGPFVVE